MSNWTHVAAIVRVDYLRFGEEPNIGERFEEIFGKELRYEDSFNVWDEADEHPERFLPLGSEGSLTMNVWKNPDKSCMSAYVVSIFGDLRDHYDPNAIVDWFKEKISSLWVRQATITVENEWNGTVNWTYTDEG